MKLTEAFLQFAENVVLLASSESDHQHALQSSAAKHETTGVRGQGSPLKISEMLLLRYRREEKELKYLDLI